MVSDDLAPMVLAANVGEKLAPIKDAVVKKVAVSCDPELSGSAWNGMAPAGSVVREIAKEMATQDDDLAHSIPTSHCEQHKIKFKDTLLLRCPHGLGVIGIHSG